MNDTTTEIKMDPTNLYKEEMVTDRKMGTIRILTPVNDDGSIDTGRDVVYVGQAQLMTPMGALPLAFEIPATSLSEAIDKFPGEAKQAVDKTVEELKELQRQQASSIVIPGAGGAGGGAMPGAGGGGGIQIP